MKRVLAAACVVALSACNDKGAELPTSLETDEARFAYAIGYMNTKQMDQELPGLDLDAMIAGMRTARNAEATPLIAEEEMPTIIRAHFEAMAEADAAAAAAEATSNLDAAVAFMVENSKREGVTKTDSGLQYEVMTAGEGVMPQAEDVVSVHYHGTLADGTVFDSSVDRGEPATFPVNRVIPGWVEALQMMPVGSKWKLTIPPELAYGERGTPDGSIPGNSALVFEVELLSIVEPEPAAE